jgi:hypothetical protein
MQPASRDANPVASATLPSHAEQTRRLWAQWRPSSILCAAIMACGVASIRDLGPGDERMNLVEFMTANGPPAVARALPLATWQR